MSSSQELSELPIDEAFSRVPLSDPEHAFLAGSRAIEVHVGRAALLAARDSLNIESSGDIDLVVSKEDYKHLRKMGARTIRHAFPRLSRPGRYYRRNSLSMFDGAVDVWRERWYEAARYPEGAIGVNELTENSEWNEELGVRVLTKAYLIAQRERSIAFLGSKDHLTPAEEKRLAKDKADLMVLQLEEPEITPSGAKE